MKKLFLAALLFCSLASTAQRQKLVDMVDGSISNRLFFDQQWRYRWMSNSILNGGVVSWVSGFTFAVTSATFTIQGKEYTSAGGQITLDAAHPSLPRFDVIALNTSGQIVKLTGTPSAIPAVPQVTPATQVYLTAILVGAGSTSPSGVSSVMIYNENVEWAHDDAGFTAGINFDNLVNPYAGVKSIDVTAPGPSGSGGTAGMKFADSILYPYSNFTLLRFYIRLKTALPAGASIQVALGIGNEQLTTLGAAHGFNPLLVGSYQNITIPISEFNKLGNSFQAFYFRTNRNTVGFYLDKIELQTGITSGGGNSGTSDSILVDSPLHIFKNSVTGTHKITIDNVSATRDGYLTAAQLLSLGGGGGLVTDSSKLSNDSFYIRKNGVFVFQHMITRVNALAAIGASANANGASISGNTLTLQPASGSFGGIITTGTQSFAGSKTFNSDLTVNGITVGTGPSGLGNVAIGEFTYTAGNNMTTVGYLAGRGYAGGANITAIGQNSGFSSSGTANGNNNVYLGNNATYDGTSGAGATNYSIAIGASATIYNNIKQAAAIGAKAQVRCDSCASYGDTLANIKHGFGTANPKSRMHVVGDTRLEGALSVTGYQTVTSGATSTISNNTSNYIYNPASVAASLTITMPAAPTDGQFIYISFGGTIAAGSPVVTALSIAANTGYTLYQALTPTTANGGDTFIYHTEGTVIRRIK